MMNMLGFYCKCVQMDVSVAPQDCLAMTYAIIEIKATMKIIFE